MDYLKLPISEIHAALLEGKVTPLELVKEAIELAKKDNNNAFEYISEKEAIYQVTHLDENKKNNLLWGIPFVLKDNFSTKDIPTYASSNILKGYVPTFSSEVYLRLINEGAILIGKTTLDELAMGGNGITGRLEKIYNPWDKEHLRKIGGSSSGSAAAVSAGIVPFSIGSDTGDSTRKPASYAALVGFKPTWGRISRFGLMPFAESLDHVGYFARNVLDSAFVLECLAGKDEKDMTSSDKEVVKYSDKLSTSVNGIKIAIIDEIYNSIKDETVKKEFEKTISELSKNGAIINHVHMDINLCRAIYPTYMVLSSSNAVSNTSCYDGIKFGLKGNGTTYEEMVVDARTKGFSFPIKKRLIIGGYSFLEENHEEVYVRAQKCRGLIINKVNIILKENDFIYLPTAPSVAPRFDEKVDLLSDEYLIADNYLAIANFSGLPSLSLPIGFKDGLPFGANIIGGLFEEEKVLSLAYAIESYTGLKNLIAPSEDDE